MRKALELVEALDRRAVGAVGVKVVEREPRLLRVFGKVGQMRVDRLPVAVEGGKPRRTPFEERVERLFKPRVVRAVRKEKVHARHLVEDEEVSHAGGFERPVLSAREHARTHEDVGHHVDRIRGESERFGPFVRGLRRLLVNDPRQELRLEGGRDGLEEKGREGDFLRFVERFQKVRHVRVPKAIQSGHSTAVSFRRSHSGAVGSCATPRETAFFARSQARGQCFSKYRRRSCIRTSPCTIGATVLRRAPSAQPSRP